MTVPDPVSLFSSTHYNAVSQDPSPCCKPSSASPVETAGRPKSRSEMAKQKRSELLTDSASFDAPKKDLRHLDSRSGVNAALKVEKVDTRFDSGPRFDKPPTNCYIDRAKPKWGTCNDEMDNVLADVLYGRPVSKTESGRIKDNRVALRKHVGPRGGNEFFVASFQQRSAQDESATNVQVARRVLMSSKSARPDPSCALRQMPWFRQEISQVGTRNADAQRLGGRGSTPDSKPRIPNGSSAGCNGASPQVSELVAKSPNSGRASGSRIEAQPRALLRGSGRPPPSTSSVLSAENLMAHERSLDNTPRSARVSRECSQASRHSSRSSRNKRAGSCGARSARSDSCDSRISAASAPPRRIDWDRVVASAEREGAHLRAASSDSRRAGKVAEDSFASPSSQRQMRGAGLFSPRFHTNSQSDAKEYRRCRQAGRPPPSMLQGVFDREAELASPRSTPYRRMRSRSTSPLDKLPMPLGLLADR